MSKLRSQISPNSRTIYRQLERKLNSSKLPSTDEFVVLISEIKYSLRPDQSRELSHAIRPEVLNIVFGNPLPKSSNQIGKIGKHRWRDSFYNEMNWLSFCIDMHKDELNLFIELELKFEKFFLLGRYDEAEDVLNEVDDSICVSKWSIEKRLLLAEYTNQDGSGRTAVFDFLTKDTERLLKINLSYISNRLDRQLPIYRYEFSLSRFIERQKGIRLADYFLYELNYFENLTPSELGLIIFLNSTMSIIDRYCTFLKICTTVQCATAIDEGILQVTKDNILHLATIINDSRLLNLSVTCSEKPIVTPFNEHSIKFIEIASAYYECQFIECHDLGIKLLAETPWILELSDIVIRAAILSGNSCPEITRGDSLINRIYLDIYNVLQKNENHDSSLYDLTKIAKSICSPIWSAHLMAFVRSENATYDIQYNFKKHQLIDSGILHPLIYGERIEDSKESVLEELFVNSGILVEKSYWFCNKNINCHEELTSNSFFGLLNAAKYRLHKREFHAANEIVTQVKQSASFVHLINVLYIKLELVKVELECLIGVARLVEAANLLCISVIQNPSFYLPLNNKELIEKVLNSNDEIIQKNIATPVLARMYASRPNLVWIAYDNFMFCNELKFPRDIFSRLDFNPELVKYFLRYVCEKDVFDSSPDFNSQEELDEERIAICNHLSKIDSATEKEHYIEEITEIEKNILIKKGVKEVNQSKIYVDESGIRYQINAEIKDRFSRGAELLKLSQENIDQLLDVSSSVLVLLFDSNDNGTLKYKAFTGKYGITNHPHFENFTETFKLIRDRFISSNEFGLDSYISMRIRHGTLLGQIRSIFERLNLITKRGATSKQYVPNDYWLNRLSQDPKSRNDISEKLNSFSENIDAMSEEIKNTFLQVHTEQKDRSGLFDFSFSEEELVSLYKERFHELKTADEFLDVAFACLWERTEINLESIRNKFTGEIYLRTTKALDQLSSTIEKTIKKHESQGDLKEFTSTITTCQTDVGREFEKIALWFRRSYSNTINEFTVELLLRTSLSIVNKIHPSTPINNPSIDGDVELVILGQYFTMLIDVMRNLFDNIVLHSQLTEPDLDVSIQINKVRNKLVFTVENNVSPSVDLEAMNSEIATTQFRLNRAIDEEMVRKEGGSGYPKVKKIIKYNLKRNNYEILLSQITSERKFTVTISFEYDGMIKNQA